MLERIESRESACGPVASPSTWPQRPGPAGRAVKPPSAPFGCRACGPPAQPLAPRHTKPLSPSCHGCGPRGPPSGPSGTGPRHPPATELAGPLGEHAAPRPQRPGGRGLPKPKVLGCCLRGPPAAALAGPLDEALTKPQPLDFVPRATLAAATAGSAVRRGMPTPQPAGPTGIGAPKPKPIGCGSGGQLPPGMMARSAGRCGSEI